MCKYIYIYAHFYKDIHRHIKIHIYYVYHYFWAYGDGSKHGLPSDRSTAGNPSPYGSSCPIQAMLCKGTDSWAGADLRCQTHIEEGGRLVPLGRCQNDASPWKKDATAGAILKLNITHLLGFI